ncbi:MAG TPA: transcription termination/antitermination NusG family protein [Gemmataceae bacterium]|nr:transcription termination/antitermination NusG family protein [Gemmataceae bacterium]
METHVSPEDLFHDPAALETDVSEWWVLHTRPRAEKSLARHFVARNLSFFLPLYQHQWRNRGRLFRAHMPLFPSYIFLRGDAETRRSALETNQVVRAIPVADTAQLCGDLVRVYRMMQAGMLLAPEDQLQPGAAVEIIAGPLAGLEGKIIQRGKQMRFFVEVRLLQRGVSVEIEGWMIRLLATRSTEAATNSHMLV